MIIAVIKAFYRREREGNVENILTAGKQICKQSQSLIAFFFLSLISYLLRSLKQKENWLHLITYKNVQKVFITQFRRVNHYKVPFTQSHNQNREICCVYLGFSSKAWNQGEVVLTQDRWCLILATHEDWWSPAPGSGRRQDRFASIWDGYHKMLRLLRLRTELQSYLTR